MDGRKMVSGKVNPEATERNLEGVRLTWRWQRVIRRARRATDQYNLAKNMIRMLQSNF